MKVRLIMLVSAYRTASNLQPNREVFLAEFASLGDAVGRFVATYGGVDKDGNPTFDNNGKRKLTASVESHLGVPVEDLFPHFTDIIRKAK